jgi:hypothetical protein
VPNVRSEIHRILRDRIRDELRDTRMRIRTNRLGITRIASEQNHLKKKHAELNRIFSELGGKDAT